MSTKFQTLKSREHNLENHVGSRSKTAR